MEATALETLVIGLAGVFMTKGADWIRAIFQGGVDKLKGGAEANKAEAEANKVEAEANKVEVETKTTEVEKASALQREIIADLRKEISKLVLLLKELEEERLNCRVENATLKAEMRSLRKRVDELGEDLKAAK